MRDRRGTYAGYSIGCAIVWAIALSALRALGEGDKLRKVLPVFAGWWVGWTSATVARHVYPPPKSRSRGTA